MRLRRHLRRDGGCIVAVVYLRIQFGKSNQILRQGGGEAKSTRQTMKELLVIAIPITLGSAGLQIINLFDTMIYMRRAHRRACVVVRCGGYGQGHL